MSNSVRPHRQQPVRLPVPAILQAKNTGVGCHFLLQCMKVKSESEVAQSCLTLHDPLDCSLPGSSVHGIFQARVLEWGAIAFSGATFYLQYILMRYPAVLTTRCKTLLQSENTLEGLSWQFNGHESALQSRGQSLVGN